MACRKAKDCGYPHELWTTRLLASHAREHGPGQGHACLANLVQGTVCKILDQEDVKPHKVRYYLERGGPDFAEKMAEVLCVYRQVGTIHARRAATATNNGATRPHASKHSAANSATSASRLSFVLCVRPGVNSRIHWLISGSR